MLVLLASCAERKQSEITNESIHTAQEKQLEELQEILDTTLLNGSILVYDLKKDSYYSNNFKWARNGKLPASTFKIPNSIIALETGIVESDSTSFPWDGMPRGMKIWEQDLTFVEAFRYSCVPCYQEVARKIGSETMNSMLTTLDYPTMQVDDNNIDQFWLSGSSRINQFQQIDFLKRLHESALPISPRTEGIVKKMMILEKNDHYTMRGKTGWSISGTVNNGWYVGYLLREGQAYFFATNVEPRAEFDMSQFPKIRKEVTIKALQELNII